MADRFLASDLAVRLTPDVEEGRRRPAQWSTASHRALEDRTLALMGALVGRQVPAVKGAALDTAQAAAAALGEDQAKAVKVLAGEGGGLRAVLAPAGFGKTTMLHVAAQAAASHGRSVVAVATTAKAVAELAGAGLDARTIARLRVELASGPLAAGTVVVLDEVSQTPTRDVEAVLAAVDTCPGGSLWVLGDPRQSQPVGAGGAADYIERLANEGLIPSARLTVNRRQRDPADRKALGLLRQGEAAASQQLRTEHGWEHDLATPAETRRTMADAVCTDIGRYGAEQVAVLVVSHTDAEDLADRVRARLAATGTLTGPALVGPGWTAEREYRAGDRVLLHARCGPSGSPLVNGTTATVTGVNSDGLAVRLDGSGQAVSLPIAFVQSARKDGSPNVSHAWARTVDGARAAPGKPATCSAAPPWMSTAATPASPVPASPPTPGTRPGSPLSTTAVPWPTSGTRLNRSPVRWPASPTLPWRHAATPGSWTASSANGSPSMKECSPAGRATAKKCSPQRPRTGRQPRAGWRIWQPSPLAPPGSWRMWDLSLA